MLQKTNDKLTKVSAAVKHLVSLKKKKIVDSDLKAAAEKFEVSFATLKRSWDNFQQTGGRCLDRRVSSNNGHSYYFKPTVVRICKKNKAIDAHTAGNIIREYMNNNEDCVTSLANKHNISVVQFYSWIHELNVSGTLLGVTVLDPKKYAKIEVKDVIWLYKHPNATRKSIQSLTDWEKLAYTRVADILLQYLP